MQQRSSSHLGLPWDVACAHLASSPDRQTQCCHPCSCSHSCPSPLQSPLQPSLPLPPPLCLTRFRQLFKDSDANGNGRLSHPELIGLVTRIPGLEQEER